MRITLFALLLLFSFTVQAGWKLESIQFANQTFAEFPSQQEMTALERASLATLWSGSLRELKSYHGLESYRANAELPEFFAKDVPVYLYEHRSKAPLIVFIPGVFGDSNNGAARAILSWFSRMGYHVLTIPNTWSQSFQKAHFLPRHGYPIDEADAVVALTDWAIQQIGARRVSEVHIAGESLGAFSAAVTYARDSQSSQPLFTGGATLLWPPISLVGGIAVLDNMITTTKAEYESQCRAHYKKISSKIRVLRGKVLSAPTSQDIHCATGAIAQEAFKVGLDKLARSVASIRGFAAVYTRDLDFNRFINSYTPRYASALDQNDEASKLDFWLANTESAQRSNIRILTSQDDFLNTNENWIDSLATGLGEDQVIFTGWGGHIGLTNTTGFKKLLQKEFAR
ncbi:MAG TPA: alpha/beta hydrolase [Bdellovibrionales bacterium]|nr:alpha/beta hydrolase [Bdellovibrionales bacterium]